MKELMNSRLLRAKPNMQMKDFMDKLYSIDVTSHKLKSISDLDS